MQGGTTMINMAIIGLGGMGVWHLKRLQREQPDIKVIGAYDVREEAKADIVRRGLINYDSPQQIYEDKSIDLVLITTPNDVHKSYAIALLEADKNVICEKPVTLNAAELEEIITVAERSGKLFTIHQNRRWDRDYQTIQKIIADKHLNNPYIIESRVQGSRRGMFGWRAFKPNGGGMVLDWGIHLIDQIMDLVPERVVSVYANLHCIGTKDVDDNFTAILRFEGGLTALVNVSMNCFILQPRWHMCCEDGTAVIEAGWENVGKIVKLADPTELDWDDAIIYTAAGPTRSMLPRPKETTIELPLPEGSRDLKEFYTNVIEVIQGKAKPIVTTAQALRVMKVIDAVFESERIKTAVTTSI